jgi:uncharacterized cysteine cluster protein YcgN (CxxCxxCC family)
MTEFWETKRLDELTDDEWEALCDGCGRCCLRKLEDEETGEIHYTDVACRLLDITTCRCTDYPRRLERVDDCVRISRDRLEELSWMPATCAYRLRHENRPLPDWHPLVSGRAESVHEAGISVRHRVLSEHCVHEDDVHQRLIEWVSSHS